VPNGEPFSESQSREISRIIHVATAETGLQFSVFVGAPEGKPRPYAERLLAALGDAASDAVLVMVSPAERRLEIVTGKSAARRLPDRACALAALSMTSAFTGGDLVGGITTGLRMLAESAGQVRAVAGARH
jgi:uncharacterized membrane protein YgcG